MIVCINFYCWSHCICSCQCNNNGISLSLRGYCLSISESFCLGVFNEACNVSDSHWLSCPCRSDSFMVCFKFNRWSLSNSPSLCDINWGSSSIWNNSLSVSLYCGLWGDCECPCDCINSRLGSICWSY